MQPAKQAQQPAIAFNQRTAVLYGLAAVLLWSTVATGFKLGLQVMAVEQLLLLGTAISWLTFLFCGLWQRCLVVPFRTIVLAASLGLVNPAAYYLVLFHAYDLLPAHIAQPINYTWALTLALLAAVVLKQKLTLYVLLGMLVSYSGVVLLLLGAGIEEQTNWNPTGVGLALFSTLLWAIYWLITTRAQSHSATELATKDEAARVNSPNGLNKTVSSPTAMMFWSFTSGLPIVALVCYLGPGWPEINQQNMGYGAWVGLIEMGITFLLWQQALLRAVNAARVAQLIFISPFLSLVFIHLFLDENITSTAVIGLLVIVCGLALSQYGQASTAGDSATP